MAVPKIDKEILEKYFAGEKYEQKMISPRKSLRTYDINDGAVTLVVGTPRTIEHIGELAAKIIGNPGMSVYMTTYKHYVVCIMIVEALFDEIICKGAMPKSTSYITFPETIDLPDESGPAN